MKIERTCLYCKVLFLAEAKEVNRGNARFCSIQCGRDFNKVNRKKPEPNVECAYCKIKFYKNNTKKKGSKSGLYFCCVEHKNICQKIGGIKEIIPAHYGTATDIKSTVYRAIAFAEKPAICERCGFDKEIASIVIHHKDRDRSNNHISNLEVLCANCHAIEHWGKQKVDQQGLEP